MTEHDVAGLDEAIAAGYLAWLEAGQSTSGLRDRFAAGLRAAAPILVRAALLEAVSRRPLITSKTRRDPHATGALDFAAEDDEPVADVIVAPICATTAASTSAAWLGHD
jgi:hypothetical protein